MNKWIDSDATTGTTGYLVETINNNARGAQSFSIRERPLRTNQSNEPRLSGWCGETNNLSRFARGVWKVVRTNKDGTRAQIVRVEGADLAAFLEADGYPELIPETAAA